MSAKFFLLLSIFFVGAFLFVPAESVFAAHRPLPCGSFGDVDGDGFVSTADATLIAQFFVGGTLTAAEQARADVNGDTTVTIADARLITNYEAGNITTFPVCGGRPLWLQTAPSGPTSGLELVDLAKLLTNWVFAGFLLVAVFIIALAGWQFISSGGDPQNIAKARSKLLWAAIAVVIAVMARGIPVVVRSIIIGN